MQHKFKSVYLWTLFQLLPHTPQNLFPQLRHPDIVAENYHGTSTGILYEAQFLI